MNKKGRVVLAQKLYGRLHSDRHFEGIAEPDICRHGTDRGAQRLGRHQAGQRDQGRNEPAEAAGIEFVAGKMTNTAEIIANLTK